MKIEEIYAEWAKDGEIDQVNISNESARIPKLHNKYYMLYVQEGLKLKKFRADYKKMKGLREDWYLGELAKEDLDQLNWQPYLGRKPLKTELNSKLECDETLINYSLKIGLQESLVDYLESIIKQITNRGFQLKTIVDWERFRTGAM